MKWEYKVLEFFGENSTLRQEAELNNLGAEGWDLSFPPVVHERAFLFYLKRPKKEAS